METVIKLKEKIENHKWGRLYFNPKNKTFRPIAKSLSEINKKIKNSKTLYPDDTEIVCVTMGAFPSRLQNKDKKPQWVFSVSIFIANVDGNKIIQKDNKRTLTVNWYLADLLKKMFTMSSLETLVKITYHGAARSNPVVGISVSDLKNKLKK